MTGAGSRIETDAAEIEKLKKGTTTAAKQGIYFKNAESVKASNVSTEVVWKAVVEGEEEGSASLIPTLGAIGLAIASLAF